MNAAERVRHAVQTPREPVTLLLDANGERLVLSPASVQDYPLDSQYRLPPIYPEWLGDRLFTHTHKLRFAYVVGEMAQGIATPAMVVAAARSGLLGFFGSAGLPMSEVKTGIEEIAAALAPETLSWGANLIHSPQQPDNEAALVDLFLAAGVQRVSASAFMQMSPQIVRYAASGLRLRDDTIVRTHHVFAKVSRAEVAEQFMAPAPRTMLADLVSAGLLTAGQAELAALVPVAAEITAESDSGGHTDNRPASVLFSSLVQARERVVRQHGLSGDAIRIGLAGGMATPQALSAAWQMGAAYVLTGSINQSAVESGLSLVARETLTGAGPADVMMAPAADMFEQGVNVQVLKRGTLFAANARRLHSLYRNGTTLEALTPRDKRWFEMLLGESIEAAWVNTCRYLEQHSPGTIAAAECNGNAKFALLCRRYLFMAAQWAREGAPERQAHFQIWCGPAMGAFNEWVAGTCLEPLAHRSTRQIAWNLLEGAAQLTRAGQLRSMGVAVPASLFSYRPRVFD